MDGLTSPAVTMLWESVDPYVTLTERFAFADPDEAAAWLRSTLADHWGIDVRRCRRLVLSAGNALAWLETDAGPLLAKWTMYPQLHERLAELARLVAWLHDRGMPVSAPLPARDGRLQVALPQASLGLQAVRAGEFLDPGNRDQVEQAGAVLARLHRAMAGYPRANLIGVPPWCPHNGPLPERIERSLEEARRFEFAETETLLRDRLPELAEESLPPPQLVHRDIRSANLLCTGREVTAVLDFEEAAPDYAVVDLAKAAVMLGTRFRNWTPVAPRTHRYFVNGYRRVRCLSPSEIAWLPVLMAAVTLRFAGRGEGPVGWGASARQLASKANLFR